MKEIHGRILAGLGLGSIATICFLNKFLTAAMVSAILVISLIEYQDVIVAALTRLNGKEVHKVERDYSGIARSYLVIGVQMLLPIMSVFYDLNILFLVNMFVILAVILLRMYFYWDFIAKIPENELPNNTRILLLVFLIIALDILGYCYFIVGFTYGYLILKKGFSYLFVGWLAAWQGDNGGLLFGRLWGKHKMSPWISPKKTYEGGAGAIIFSAATMALCYVLSNVQYCKLVLPNFGLWEYVLLGIVGSTMAVLGDLVESLMKRAAEVKDSSSILGTLGGMLDRVDSLCAAFPAIYYFYLFVGA